MLLVDTARACSQAGHRDEALRRLASEEVASPEVRCRPRGAGHHRGSAASLLGPRHSPWHGWPSGPESAHELARAVRDRLRRDPSQ